jgi:membrane-associated protein
MAQPGDGAVGSSVVHVLAELSLNPEHIIRTFGTIGLIAIIFAESGLLVGFFLPGDSLLFTAGLLASQGKLNLAVVLIGCFLAAFIGDQVGYAFGKKVGPSIFKRPDSRWFKHENVERAEEFFEHHGSKTIVLARFVPVVRTFAPIVAGVSSMRYRTFVAYNVIGAFLWAIGVTLLGYWLGETVPNIDKYLLPIIFGIIVLSLVPVWIEYRRQKNKAAKSASSAPVDESRPD